MSAFKHLLSLALIAILLSAAFHISTPEPASAEDSWTAMTSNSTSYLNGVWGSSGSDVFAVGEGGAILHYNGSTWSAMTSATVYTLNGVWGSSGSDVFAVGEMGAIIHYNGSAWSVMTSDNTIGLTSVWGTSSSDVYAAGYAGIILHYNGSTWSTVASGTTYNELRGIWGSSGSDIFIVGGVGTILHYNGSTWSIMTNDATNNQLRSVWGSSGSNVFAVDIAGTIIHYDGSAWSIQSSGLVGSLVSIWGSSSSDIFAVGYGGVIVHYNGSTWSIMTSGTTYDLISVWGQCASTVFTVGSLGTILHYGSGVCPAAGVATTSLNTTLGTVNISASNGLISYAAWIPTIDIRCSSPANYIFPWGMFAINIAGVPVGGTASVTLLFPTPLPLGAKYYKCINGNLIDCSGIITRINEYTLMLSLQDGSFCDADNVANGSIIDPGGPAYPLNTPTSHSSTVVTSASQQPVALANITVKSASLSSAKVTPGSPVTVTANVANIGTGNGSTSLKVYVNGSVDSTQAVSVNSGSATTVTFTVSRSKPGTYSVYVGGTQAGSFKVDQFADPNIILVISGSLIFFAFVVGVIYMTRQRRAATYAVRNDPRYDPRNDPRNRRDDNQGWQ